MQKAMVVVGSGTILLGLAVGIIQGMIQGLMSGSFSVMLAMTLPGIVLAVIWAASPTTSTLMDVFDKKKVRPAKARTAMEYYEDGIREELNSDHRSMV